MNSKENNFRIYNKEFVLNNKSQPNGFEISHNCYLTVAHYPDFSPACAMFLAIQVDDEAIIEYDVKSESLEAAAAKLQEQLGETFVAIEKFFEEE